MSGCTFSENFICGNSGWEKGTGTALLGEIERKGRAEDVSTTAGVPEEAMATLAAESTAGAADKVDSPDVTTLGGKEGADNGDREVVLELVLVEEL